MDLAQRANRAKKDLQAAVSKPESISLRHATESFDAFVDAVVEEITNLKKAATSAPNASSAEAKPQMPESATAERGEEPQSA